METFKDLAVVASPIVTLIIGYLGLRTWRTQLKATRDADLARRILVALYEIRSDLTSIRRPARSTALPPDKTQWDREAVEEAWAKQYQQEWDELATKRAALYAASVEAEAVWDRDFRKALIPLENCIYELQLTLADLLASRRSGRSEYIFEPEKVRNILYNTGKDNPFTQEVERAIEVIDAVVRPHFLP